MASDVEEWLALALRVHPPETIDVVVPGRTWDVLGLGRIRVTGQHDRIWFVDCRQSRGPRKAARRYHITMDLRRAVELRDSGRAASTDRALNIRQRSAAWYAVSRITQALDEYRRREQSRSA
jgi:hypothetical protein